MRGERRDSRTKAIAFTTALIILGGAAILQMPRLSPLTSHLSPSPHSAEIATLFDQGVAMLHAKKFDYAIVAFHKVLQYDPRMPEAHVNMGYALLGQREYARARASFEAALELRARQDNAYYGLAVALEGEGDLRGAIGAMRTYVHLARPDDPYRRKAEAALWEWESAITNSGKTSQN